MAFRLWADDDPLIVVFVSSHPSSTKKKKNAVKVGPPLTKLSGSAHAQPVTWSPAALANNPLEVGLETL